MRKGLVMLNMSYRTDWKDGMVNRNFHILQTLITGNYFDKILSVDFLPFNFKKQCKTFWRGRLWRHSTRTVYRRSLFSRVESDPQSTNIYYLTALNLGDLKEILNNIQFPQEQLVVWSYDPFSAPIFKQFPKAIKVFDAVDNWLEHPVYKSYRERLTAGYELVKKDADIIFTVSEGLVEFFDKQSKIVYIPNGVDPQHFIKATSLPFLQKLKKTGTKIIGYHGVIQSRVNFAILRYLSAKHPDYFFVLAGPVWREVRREMSHLLKWRNVKHVGFVPYQKLPNYLAGLDVAIIPHKVDTFTQTMNPLKIYEYLAAGKPIVSTAVSGVEQFQDLIQLAVSPEDFSREIQLALAADNTELQQRRHSMAEQHSWQQRVKLMMEVIARQNQ